MPIRATLSLHDLQHQLATLATGRLINFVEDLPFTCRAVASVQ
ncbi:MAG: hypothetical protein ACK56I_11040 [bacterium]